MALNNEKDKKSKIYLFVIILLLALINVGLIWNLVNKNNKITFTEEALTNTQEELADLDNLKQSLEEELGLYKSKNAELDKVITEKDKELQGKIASIRSLLKKDGVTKEELNKARLEISDLRMQIQQFTAQVDSLSQEVQYLKDENYVVKKEVELEKQKVEVLETEKSDLQEEVTVASRLYAGNIMATPIRIRMNGQEKETDKKSRTDKIKVTFTMDRNDGAKKGDRIIYMKILSPSKSTLHDVALGSGTFTYNGEESLYTSKQVVNFQNKNEEVTFYYEKPESLVVGNYEVHLFSETNQLGSGKFSLR